MIDTQKPEHRSSQPRPNWLLFLLLVFEAFVLLSEQMGWFRCGEDKIITLAVAVAAAVIAPLLWMLFFVVRIVFRNVARWTFRTRLQFSLRSLLLAVTLCAVLCSGLSWRRYVERQRELIRDECREVAWNVDVNWDKAHWWTIPPTFACLTPNDFYHLQRLPADDEIVDERLNRLRPHLRYVETLLLDGTAVADHDLEHIEDMTELRTLGLGSTIVTDDGLIHLARLAKLEELYLSGAGGSSRTVAWYARFCKRHDFKLPYQSKITDRGMASLRQLTRLRGLSLRMTDITDSGLKHLAALRRLEGLDLSETLVTDEGVRNLQQALPNCKIQH